MTDILRIDLGSGRQTMECPEYIHIDKWAGEHIEYAWDLNLGLPREKRTEGDWNFPSVTYTTYGEKIFKDNTVDEFRSHHSLEHLSNTGFMELMDELWDALKSDGFLHLYTPNGAHLRAAHSDPTHRMTFTQWTMDYFCREALNAFPYTEKVWEIDDGYPKINGTAPDDLWELEWVLRPVKSIPQ